MSFNFHIDIVGNVLLFVFFLLAGIAFSVWVYRYTNPPVAALLRRTLLAFRLVVLILIIFILFEPLISMTWQRTEKPVVALLMDTSASMALSDGPISRAQSAREAWQSVRAIVKKQHIDIITYEFADQLTTARHDSFQFNRDGTDIANALNSVRAEMVDRNLSAIVMITDGNYNIGENPLQTAEAMSVPVFPVAVGNPEEQRDVLISTITTNQITYAQNEVPVEVTIRSHGYAGKKVAVQLRRGNKVIDSQYATLSDRGMEAKVRLHYTPEEPGQHKYQVRIPSLEDELTAANNVKTFYVKVLKSKMQVVMVAGEPCYDARFFKQALQSDPNIEVTTWTRRAPGTFYEGTLKNDPSQFAKVDVFVWIDYPQRNTNSATLRLFEDAILKYKKPLLLISGPSFYLPALQKMSGLLPVSVRQRNMPEKTIYFSVTPIGENHPIMRLHDQPIENQLRWAELPPIYLSMLPEEIVPGSEVLLTVDKLKSRLRTSRETVPLLVARRLADQKYVVMLGHGIWRWDFLMRGLSRYTDAYTRFVTNTIRWLTTLEDNKQARIVSDKPVYRSGETITFTAETYYEDYRPLSGANVRVSVQNGTHQFDIQLHGTGPGTYEGNFRVLTGGDYTFVGTATYQGKELGTDHGRFSVEPFRLEYVDTRMNAPLLQQLARISGGRFVPVSRAAMLDTALHVAPRRITESRQWEIWHQWYLLVAVIVLLSTEWFVRKRTGMV